MELDLALTECLCRTLRPLSAINMPSWTPLAPTKQGGPSNESSSRFSVLKPTKPSARTGPRLGPSVGRWPETIILRIIHYLPVPDLPSIARCNKAFSRLVRDEAAWKYRCRILNLNPGAFPTEWTALTHRRATQTQRSTAYKHSSSCTQ